MNKCDFPVADAAREFSQNMAGNFPFKANLSLQPLLAFWQEQAQSPIPEIAHNAKEVLNRVGKIPELNSPHIKDKEIIKSYPEEMDLLMSALFPPALQESELSIALPPFSFEGIYATPLAMRLMKSAQHSLKFSTVGNMETMIRNKILFWCSMIMERFYGINLFEEPPYIVGVPDPETGLLRYFKSTLHYRFMEVTPKKELRKLEPEDIRKLLNSLDDVELWLEYFPPADFEGKGFVIMNLVDVTGEEILSQMKYDLLEKGSTTTVESRDVIQSQLRSLFKIPDLRMGLSVMSFDQTNLSRYTRNIWSCLVPEDPGFKMKHFPGSIYEKMVKGGKTVIVDDLERLASRTGLEEHLLEKGLRNIALAPLYSDGKMFGVMELGTAIPGKLNAISVIKLQEVLPLFEVALERSLEELENRVQSVVKDQYTAIHPTVEWRFQDAAVELMEAREKGVKAEADNLVFEDVYPLYGMADIRGSSTERNRSIRGDLLEQLKLARSVLKKVGEISPLPVLKELDYRVEKHVEQVKGGLGSGDEVSLLEFFKNEIDPVFLHLEKENEAFVPLVGKYRSALDPDLEIIYKRRKAYEESVTQINDSISEYLDEAQEAAQSMFPHYFQRYKTDGVDYNIYIGQSLVNSRAFDEMYLRNLRLWQLETTCGITRLSHQLKEELPVPLETAQLILVYSSPLSIRFRLDEKQFDVDGAYNIRYEIVKKRIDKAYIKGTQERLTQPGKIAVVYSRGQDAVEYEKYIEYLLAKGFLEGEVEHLDLEDLQGVNGLKALRVSVRFPESPVVDSSEDARELKTVN
jgi:hypothetical protein